MPSPALSDHQYSRSWAQQQQDQGARAHSTKFERGKDLPGLPGSSDRAGQPRSSSLKDAQPVTRRRSTKEAMGPAITTSYSDMNKANSHEPSGTVDPVDNASSINQPRRRRKSLLGALEKMNRGNSKQEHQHKQQFPPARSYSMSGRIKPGRLEENRATVTGVPPETASGSTVCLLTLEEADRHRFAGTAALNAVNTPLSSSFEDQQHSSDSGISKVNTFEPALFSSEVAPTVSTAQAWLNAKPTPSIRRRRSALGCSDTEQLLSGGDQNKGFVRIRPKAKSLRESRPSIKSLPKTEDETKVKPANYSSPRTPRTRSRVFRSPPPPPATADNIKPPSLPNVDVRQIKDEIDPPSHYPDGISHDRHRQKSMQHRADQNLTANIISNVKRKLSINKDRQAKNPAALDPERKSLPANFISPNHQGRKRDLSNGSRIGATSLSETKNGSTPNLNSHRNQQNYMRPTISFGQRQVPELSTSSSSLSRHKSSKEDLQLVSEKEKHSRPSVPPVPPMPKHHSITNNEGSKLSRPSNASRLSSSRSSGPGGISSDEQHNDIFTIAQKSLRRQASHASSFGDTEDSDNNSSLRSGKSDSDRRSNSRSKAPMSAQRTVPRNLQVSSSARKRLENNNADDTYKAMEDYYLGKTETFDPASKATISTRRRGKTLPGSLATPPPVPAALMPPMKLEPIKMAIPGGSKRRSAPKSPYEQISLTPTRIPVPRSNLSFSATSTPAIPSGMSSEEDIIISDGTTKTRRKRPEYRLSNHRRGSFNKSTASTSSPNGVSPKLRPKYTSNSTTTKSGESGYKSSLSRNRSLQNSISDQQQQRMAPKVHSQAVTTDRGIAPSMSTDRKTSSMAATSSVTRAKSFHAPGSANRKNSTALAEVDVFEKGRRPRTMSLHDRLQTMVAQHQIDEDYYCGISDTKAQATATQIPIDASRSDDRLLPSSNIMALDDRSPNERSPKSPHTMLKHYIQHLSHFEQSEIRKYKDVYFVGPHARKIRADPDDPSLNFGYDDERGDYHLVMQDHIAYRYEVLDTLGQGSFGQVVKCLDHKTGDTIAVKLIRNKKRFHAQAMTEVNILKKLVEWDPEDRFHNIRMTDYFYFRNHLCVAFECLSINLYEFIKSNNFQGFSLSLIRRFTIQMLQSLSLLYEHNVVHCDLKPENILLKSSTKCTIKVIDFGSSCVETERVYTYIQSRFYRAPEVILGMAYGTPIDMWSIGCILAELYTGIPIFPGESEQDQLACIMEIIDIPPRYLVDQSSRRKLFFDSEGLPRPFVNSRGKIRKPGSKSVPQSLRCHDILFIDFIEKCLRWDPAQRMRPNEALRHEWIAQGSQTPAVLNPHHGQIQDSRHSSKLSSSQKTIYNEGVSGSTSGNNYSVADDDVQAHASRRQYHPEKKKTSETLVDDYYYTASGIDARLENGSTNHRISSHNRACT